MNNQKIAKDIDKLINSLVGLRNTLSELANVFTTPEPVDALQLFNEPFSIPEESIVPVDIPPMPLEEAKPKRRNRHAAQGKIDIAKVRAVLEYKYKNADIIKACNACGIKCEKVSHTYYIHYANIPTIKSFLES